jgi:hypothetical protein
VGLKQRTVTVVVWRTYSEQEVQNRRLNLFPDTLHLSPTTPPTAPIYNSSLPLRSIEPTTDYHGRSAYQVNYYYYYYCRYRGLLRLQRQELEKYHFENCQYCTRIPAFFSPFYFIL